MEPFHWIMVILFGILAIGVMYVLNAHKTAILAALQTEGTKIRNSVQSNTTVQKIEAVVDPEFKELLNSAHEKLDAIRDALGGALTAAEKSTIVQSAEARLSQAEDVYAALASAIEDFKKIKQATTTTVTITPAIVAVSSPPL